jgi:8-oxo-dGTP pyrophosphatase MutT (NUDIX family)
MYISEETILDLEKKYGVPEVLTLAYEMTESEFDMVARSQKHGRAHDVTLFIIIDGKVVVIRKPMYPPGAYRAPSGGVEPGEAFEAGALRESYEETGLSIALEEYVVRAQVKFAHQTRVIDWTSHVFAGSKIAGELQPIDTHEIVEARLATVREITGNIRDALLASGSTGLRYRSELNDIVMGRLIDSGKLVTDL